MHRQIRCARGIKPGSLNGVHMSQPVRECFAALSLDELHQIAEETRRKDQRA